MVVVAVPAPLRPPPLYNSNIIVPFQTLPFFHLFPNYHIQNILAIIQFRYIHSIDLPTSKQIPSSTRDFVLGTRLCSRQPCSSFLSQTSTSTRSSYLHNSLLSEVHRPVLPLLAPFSYDFRLCSIAPRIIEDLN